MHKPQRDLGAALDGEVAATGVPELDEALGGLFWGDNVVFEVARNAAAVPFYRAVAESNVAYDRRLFVRLEDRSATYPGFDVIDAGRKGKLGEPVPLLQAVFERCEGGERNLLLFDGLESMARRWGADVAARFFARCCPQLLELGAIAYWFMPAGDEYAALRRTVEEITQCVFRIDQERLRIAKADGRPPGVEGSVFRCAEADGLPVLTPAPIVARIGAALRSARLQRSLSQSDLARLAGVSPSAISQAERGQRGLSLETVLQLSAKLNVTLDDLLRGEVATGYRLGRRRYPPRRRGAQWGEPLPLLDDREAGLRAYLVRLPQRGMVEPHMSHKGVELVVVGSGLVQVLLATGRPVLRAGEALIVEEAPIAGWRNLGVGEAALFWILRDARRDA
ncbi:MAG: XRE family transcriptional regulator [Actinomycetota bacterium]|nr:XRE family transcriptional regulator [Actinomycetota bacterium]